MRRHLTTNAAAIAACLVMVATGVTVNRAMKAESQTVKDMRQKRYDFEDKQAREARYMDSLKQLDYER